jgi:hypothetical protein
VHAVDAAVGPEIQQYHLATQVSKAQGPVSILSPREIRGHGRGHGTEP